MDFRRLVADGSYSVDELTDTRKEYVKGMEYVRDEVLDNFMCDTAADPDDSELEKIVAEIKYKALEEFKELLDCTIAEAIVMFVNEDSLPFN